MEHLRKVFSDSELEGDSVIRNFRITATDLLDREKSAALTAGCWTSSSSAFFGVAVVHLQGYGAKPTSDRLRLDSQ